MVDTAIYILAGGKSSRMGEDKATLLLDGKPMLQHVLDEISTFPYPVFLLTNHAHHASFGLTMIADVLPQRGPAGGIDAMLQHSEYDKNILLSCDMPFVDHVSIQSVYTQLEQYDVCIPTLNHDPEPLLGVYRKTIHEAWRTELEQGNNALRRILPSLNVHYISGEVLRHHNPKLFHNFNSKEDLIHYE